MEVLTKILQQGTEFDTLAETVLADRFERLVELVTMMGDQGELPIAMALANVVPGSQWVCSSFFLFNIGFKHHLFYCYVSVSRMSLPESWSHYLTHATCFISCCGTCSPKKWSWLTPCRLSSEGTAWPAKS